MACDLTLAAPDVEHPACAAKVPGDQGEDQLLVLRVGAGREFALPPPGVALPQLLVARPAHVPIMDASA
jgi:hypothetical protein